MRHYDKKIDGLYSFKQDLLTRKMKGKLSKDFQPLYSIDQKI